MDFDPEIKDINEDGTDENGSGEEHECTDPNCACSIHGIEAVKEWERQNIEKNGFYMHAVMENEDCEGIVNVHTHGLLEIFEHNDLQAVLPIDWNVLANILTEVVDRIKEGEKFEVGKEYTDILPPNKETGKDYTVVFAKAIENEREVLRLIFPDQNNVIGRGLGEPGYDLQWIGTIDE